MGLEFGVNGLRQAGFEEANGLEALGLEKSFQVRRREMLHDRVVDEIFQHFLAAGLGDVRGDEHEMQFSLVGAQGVAAHHQPAGF